MQLSRRCWITGFGPVPVPLLLARLAVGELAFFLR
jgi:hypothetical protein